MSSEERDALQELVNCVEKMVALSPHAEFEVWRETRDWLHAAWLEYRTALSKPPPDHEDFEALQHRQKNRRRKDVKEPLQPPTQDALKNILGVTELLEGGTPSGLAEHERLVIDMMLSLQKDPSEVKKAAEAVIAHRDTFAAEQVGGDAALREVLSELTQIVRDGPSLEEFRRNDRYHQAYFYLASKVLAAIPGGGVRCTATGVEEGRPSQQCCLVQGHTLPHDFTPTVRLSAFVEEMKRVAPAEAGDAALREEIERLGNLLDVANETIGEFAARHKQEAAQEELNARTVRQYPPDGIPAQGDDDG